MNLKKDERKSADENCERREAENRSNRGYGRDLCRRGWPKAVVMVKERDVGVWFFVLSFGNFFYESILIAEN